jgi:hypothetical protein
MTIDDKTRQLIAQYLGREPRGLQEVAAWYNNEPAAVRVASMVDGKPFPTLFWLVHPEINLTIDRLEANGLIAVLQQKIDIDVDLQNAMKKDHEAYIDARANWMSEEVKQEIDDKQMHGAFDGRGIGGIADFSRIRCLHTWYGAHLVITNTVGQLLEPYLQKSQ